MREQDFLYARLAGFGARDSSADHQTVMAHQIIAAGWSSKNGKLCIADSWQSQQLAAQRAEHVSVQDQSRQHHSMDMSSRHL